MTLAESDLLRRLKRCRLGFGGLFIDSLRPGDPITEKQGLYLAKLGHSYRKQLEANP